MKLKINKYCSEIDILQHLKPDCFNLVVASTGSGKTRFALDLSLKGHDVSFVAPFTGITNQVHANYPDLSLEVGTDYNDNMSMAGGKITTFHSIPKLLELKNIDVLVIDEIHSLINYASFTRGMLNLFWETITKLRAKHPHMKIMALTGTPQFVRMMDFIDFNIIVLEQRETTAKPDEIYVSRSWTKEYGKNENYIALYPSCKMGKGWAQKHGGAYIDSKTKNSSQAYSAIVEGKMPSSRVFTSTLLATGISITDPVDTVYTNWLPLTDIAQMSSRPRLGRHKLKITQIPNPWFLRGGMDKPDLQFGLDFEQNLRLLSKYETWYSWMAHQDESDLYHIILQMLWLPHDTLPEL